MDIFQVLFYQPTFNLLVFLYNLFSNNLGLAIVAIAIIFKLITGPIVYKQRMQMQESAKKNNALDMQAQVKELQEKYKDNPQELLKEQLKLQGNMLSPFRGCLPIIITLVLVINVRNVILDLSNRGWIAFNEVAYVENAKKSVDLITLDLSQYKIGENNLNIEIITGDKESDKFMSNIKFWVFEKDSEKFEYDKLSREYLSKNTNNYGQKQNAYGSIIDVNKDLSSNLTIYSPIFKNNDFVISKQDLAVTKFYIRFKSDIKDDWLSTAKFNNNDILVASEKGENVNLDFFGIDLSKTATDILHSGYSPIDFLKSNVLPYTLIAALSGLVQFLSTKIMMGYNSAPSSKQDESKLKALEVDVVDEKKGKKKKKNKKDTIKIETVNDVSGEKPSIDEETRRMQEQLMSMNTGGFNAFASIFAIIVALGLLGGGQFVPTGLTLFWTIQGIGDILIAVLAKNFKKFKL